MVATDIIALSLIIGFVLIIAGILIKKRGVWLSLFGSLLFVVTGLVMIGNPLEFVTGTQTTINGSIYTTSVTYATQSTGLNTMLSFVILFVGATGLFIATNYLYNNRYEED
jgi:glucose dehydrogenase